MKKRDLKKLAAGERRIAKNKRMSREHREHINFLRKQKADEDRNTELAVNMIKDYDSSIDVENKSPRKLREIWWKIQEKRGERYGKSEYASGLYVQSRGFIN